MATLNRFYTQLAILTVALGLALFLSSFISVFKPYLAFSYLTLGVFVGLCVLLHQLALRAALSKNKHAFTQLVMGFSFVKMALAAILVIVYKRIFAPSDTWFVVPFFLIYLCFTVFETIQMSKLGRIQSR